MLSPAVRPCPQCGSSVVVEHHYCPACGFPLGAVSITHEDRFVGKTLPGGYHILDLISVGGMGRVYRAEQSVLGRTVAVKIIHPHLLSDDNSAVRFMTEARAASQLNHPNSISVFDFGRTEDGQPYLVMEFLRGKDLARVAYEEGPLSFRRIVDVLTQVLAALSEAHELGIVHRDLKPENVVLEPLRRGGDFVKVLDFGLAKLKADAAAPSVTSPGIVCGTPDYMAPEQGRGDPIDGRSDLYAVGVMLFQLLTGRLPFEADSPTQVVMMHLSIPVPDPRQVAPERAIPEALVDVVVQAMSKNADHRYQDAEEFSEGLRQALALSEGYPSGERISAVPYPPTPSGSPGPAVSGASVVCPSCQETVPLARFCLECGARLVARSGAPGEHATAPRLPLPLFGRDDDLTWLDSRREAGKHAVVGVRLVAEAGMGKTRLLRDFLNRAREEGDCAVLTGPDPYGAEVGDWAVREAVRELARLDTSSLSSRHFPGANEDARAGLVQLFDSRASAHGTAPTERRFLVAEALRWAVQRAKEQVSRDAAVLLAIDDLQRVDGSSRAAFSDLLGDPPASGVLVIAAHTPGFEPGWAADVTASRALSGLPPPTVQRVLRPSRPGDLDRVLSDERGVSPMYVEQLLRYKLEGGTDPPSRLGDLIALRVDTIEPNARRVLQAVAVLGDRVATDSIAALLPNGHDVEAGIAKLETAGMVERSTEGMSCSHPLLRDIVLAGIPHAVRRELHRKALRVAEKRGLPIEASAQHAYYAQDSFRALLLLEQAADRAASRGDTESEVLALRRGVEVARQEISKGELDDPLRAVLIFSRKLGASLTRAGSYSDAEGVLREALDLAGPATPDRARVLGALAHVAHGRRRKQEAMGYIDQAIEAAKQSGTQDLVTALTDTRRAWAS